MTRYQAASAIRQAMMGYDGLSSMIDPRHTQGSPESVVWLRHEIRRVNRLYQATHNDEVGRRLPRLIVATELGSRHAPAAQRRAYQTLRSLTYHSATTTLRRVGEAELAWVAADRSLAAAQEADRPLLAAVSAYRLGYVLVRLRETERALHLVLQSGSQDRCSVRRTPPSAKHRGSRHVMTAGEGCLSPHVPMTQRDHVRLTWLEPCAAVKRPRVVAWTCACRAVFYELCEGGGQTRIRRTLQAETGDVVHETHQCSTVEARAIWAALLSGRAR
ncbi:hypothetical protein [Nonomuraea sp. B1E8]|uniref:hypothetical protein n=1 Tax=unclassified Nonomuraea TaxID=2593643 RepID=UPI00325D0DAF